MQSHCSPESIQCLYIHGFRSAPCSTKAKITEAWFHRAFGATSFHAPDVNIPPEQAIARLREVYEQRLSSVPEAQRLIIGSSLGGFYATYLANTLGGRAVLINPACRPYELLHHFMGEQDNFYTGEKIRVDEGFLDQLHALKQAQLVQPKRFLVLIETGDEELDFRDASQFYQQAQLILTAGGDHSYQSYNQRWQDIENFLAKPYF